MRYILPTLLLVAMLTGSAFGQTGEIKDQILDVDEETVVVNLQGIEGLGVQVVNSGTYELRFEASADNQETWIAVGAVQLTDGTRDTSTTAPGYWQFGNRGFSHFRVRVESYTSGAPRVNISRGYGGVDALEWGGSGGGGSFNGLLLDAASGDPITDTVNDALRVNVVAGAGSGGTAIADDAAFTVATTNVTPAGALFDDVSPDSVNEGDAGAVRMSANRNLYSTIRDAAGNERGVNVTANNELLVELGAGSAAIGTVTVTDGSGALNTIIDSGTITAVTAITNALPAGTNNIGDVDILSIAAGDNNIGNVDIVTLPYAEADDDSIAGSQTMNKDISLNYGWNGSTWVRATVTTDPCAGSAKTVFVINTSTATTVEIANAVASEFFYICSINIVAAGAQTIAFVEDDTDGVGSPTAGLNGGTTASTGWSFAANGGISLGDGNGTVMKTSTANRYFGFLTGSAVQTSGTIVYVSAP